MAPMFGFAVKHFRYFFTNSDYTTEQLRRHCDPKATVVRFRPPVRNVFDLSVSDRSNRPPLTGTLRAVAIGTIEPRKNFIAAAEICAALAARLDRQVELHVIGRAGWGDDAKHLRDLPHVTLHGFLSDTAAKQLIDASDFLICSSHDEGLGLPMLEAQYSGIAVVAPDQQVFKEVLGSSAILVDPRDPNSAAEHISEQIATSNWRVKFISQSITNLNDWNGSASRDREAAIALLSRLGSSA